MSTSEEKPFVCPVCGEAFSTVEKMQKNQEICEKVVDILREAEINLMTAIGLRTGSIPFRKFSFKQDPQPEKETHELVYQSGKLELHINFEMPRQPKTE